MDGRTRFEYTTCVRGNFCIRKEKLRIQKYPDTCGRGLSPVCDFLSGMLHVHKSEVLVAVFEA